MRLRMAMVGVLAALSLAAVGVPVATAAPSAPQFTSVPALHTFHVTGLAKNGRQFKGTFAVQRFVAGANKVFAVGTLKGTFKNHHVTLYNVKMPASLTGQSTTNGARKAAASCSILHLVLAPINLNLLGLNVTLGGGTLANQPIVLDITAVPGAGNLLGNLLCGITNALNPSALTQLSGQLSQLAGVLNGLTGLLAGLGL